MDIFNISVMLFFVCFFGATAFIINSNFKMDKGKYYREEKEEEIDDDNFEKIYANIKKNANPAELNKLNYFAKRESDREIRILIAMFLGIILAFLGFYRNMLFLYIGLAILIACIIWGRKNLSSIYLKKYKEMYKKTVIPELLNSYEEKIEYTPEQGFSREMYKYADFEKFDYYNTDDLMKIIFKNNTKAFLAEVKTEITVSDNDGGTSKETLFHGVIVEAKLKNNYDKVLCLKRDSKKIYKNSIIKNIPKVELDSLDFENDFDVYSTDGIFAMRVLTHDLMEELTKFEKDNNINVELTIKEDKIFIRFFTGGIFEAPLGSKSALNKPTLYRYYKILNFTFDFVYRMTEVLNNIED